VHMKEEAQERDQGRWAVSPPSDFRAGHPWLTAVMSNGQRSPCVSCLLHFEKRDQEGERYGVRGSDGCTRRRVGTVLTAVHVGGKHVHSIARWISSITQRWSLEMIYCRTTKLRQRENIRLKIQAFRHTFLLAVQHL
jgi:hypothetical protein